MTICFTVDEPKGCEDSILDQESKHDHSHCFFLNNHPHLVFFGFLVFSHLQYHALLICVGGSFL